MSDTPVVTAPVTTPAQVPPSTQAAAVNAANAKTPTDGTPPPAKAEPAKPATPAEIRKIKIKLEGKEEELTEDEAAIWAQKGKGADKRFAEASALKKQVEEVLQLMKSNTPEAMKRLGLDPRKFSEEFLIEALKREAESPEQKKIRETEEKLKAYEKAEADRDAATKKKTEEDAAAAKIRDNQRKEAEIIAKYDTLFVAALEKSGLPKNAYTVKRMAELQRVNLKSKSAYTADQLAEVVRQDYDTEMKHRTDGLDGEKLLEFITKINPDLLKKIAKAQIAKLKGKPQQFTPANPVDPAAPPSADNGSVHKSWRDLQLARRKFQQ